VLICDRDRKWREGVRRLRGETGVDVVQAPNANAYAERFVRSIKHERLARMVPLVGIRGSVNISERRGRSASAGASLGPYLGHYAQAGLAFMPLDLRPHLLEVRSVSVLIRSLKRFTIFMFASIRLDSSSL